MTYEIGLSVILTLLGVAVAWLAYVAIVSGGDFRRYSQAQAMARRCLRQPELLDKISLLTGPAQPRTPPAPPKPSAEPLRLLTLLQREGRLLDFLLEDIQGYPDEQIGAAVRDIHRGCRTALQEHLELVPVLSGAEESIVEVPAGFDPAAIRLTGNVTGQPPFRGTLRHHGWRVRAIKLNAAPAGQDEFVVQPAEVELS